MAFAARAAAVAGALWAAGSVAAVPSAAAAAAPTSIELRPRVELSRADVRLGDIAYLNGPDLPTLRQLMAVPLGFAPRPGAPKMIEREAVVRWVEARVAPQSIRWSGATDIEIESVASTLPGEVVVDAARSALQDWLGRRNPRAQLEAASAPHDLVLPAGRPTLRVRSLGTDAPRAGRTWVWIDAWVDERFVRSTAVAFDVGLPTSEPAAGVERMTLAMADSPTTTRRAPSSEAPQVRRGERAMLRVQSGDVSIESRVDVLQDGRVGQLVRIRVAASSGEVLARVTGPGQVEVQP